MSKYTDKNALYNKNLKDLLNDLLGVKRRSLESADLKVGSNDAEKLKHENVDVIVDGEFKTISSAEVDFTATDHNVDEGYKAVFTLSHDGDSTHAITKGETVERAEDAEAPATPKDHVKLGEVEIDAEDTDFVAGTTALSNGDLNVTYTNKTDVIEPIS